jgi:hypothetical protein
MIEVIDAGLQGACSERITLDTPRTLEPFDVYGVEFSLQRLRISLNDYLGKERV